MSKDVDIQPAIKHQFLKIEMEISIISGQEPAKLKNVLCPW